MKNADGENTIAPRRGTEMVGLIDVIAATLAFVIVKRLGRRTLLIFGHIGIAICHAGVAFLNSKNNDVGVLFMILLFIIVYQVTSGPVCWLYATETTIDAAFGLCLLVLWGTVLILARICPPLMSDEGIGETNVFYLFSALSFFGAIYAYVFIKETRGLTDKEKKELFMPEIERAKLI